MTVSLIETFSIDEAEAVDSLITLYCRSSGVLNSKVASVLM
jgi:hypothetical protein